jgi:hypothetical protein
LIISSACGNCGRFRIKIADGAFVNKLPIEKDELVKAINKNGHSLEQTLVEIVVNGASACKRYFTLFGSSSEDNPDFQLHGWIYSEWVKLNGKTTLIVHRFLNFSRLLG